MAATLTVTGTAGPGTTVSAKVFTDVSDFTVHTATSMLEFVKSGATIFVSIAAAATVTATKSGTTWTLAIS